MKEKKTIWISICIEIYNGKSSIDETIYVCERGRSIYGNLVKWDYSNSKI